MQMGSASPSARAKASPSLSAQVAPEIAGQLWRIMRRGEKEETVEKLTVHGRHLKVLLRLSSSPVPCSLPSQLHAFAHFGFCAVDIYGGAWAVPKHEKPGRVTEQVIVSLISFALRGCSFLSLSPLFFPSLSQ